MSLLPPMMGNPASSYLRAGSLPSAEVVAGWGAGKGIAMALVDMASCAPPELAHELQAKKGSAKAMTQSARRPVKLLQRCIEVATARNGSVSGASMEGQRALEDRGRVTV